MTSFFGHPITIWDMVSSFAYLVICVVGLFGNLLAIYVIVRYTRMKTVTNQYILNLSISDAIFLLDLPLIIVGGLLKRWIFGVVMCKIYFATTGINMFTGSFTLAVLSGDRYLAVCHPGKAVVYRTARNARIVILLTWLVSVLLLAPIIIYANIYPQFPQHVTNDSYNSSSSSSSSSLQVSSSTLDSLNNERPQHLVKRRNLEASTDFQVRQFFFGKLLLHSSGELKSREDGLRLRKERLMADVIDRIKAALEERGRLVKRNSSKMFPSNFRTDNKMKRQVPLEDEIFDPSTTVPPVEEVQMTYTCTVDWPSKDYVIPAVHAYIIYNMVIGFVIPVMVISILYTTLVVKLSKDPEGGGSSGEGSENKNQSFGKTIKKTFLSKEYSFGKRSESFKMKSSSSPKTPTIHEDQVLAYKTPPEIMRKIGHRILSEGNVKGNDDPAPTRYDAGKISTISRQVTAQSDSVVLGKPPPVIRNISAFKQRRMQQPRITRLVTSIILVYVVCWLPYWAFQLHLITNMTAVRDSRWKLTLYHIFTFLSYCNSAINPILYVFTNQNFRDSFVVAVQCKEDVGSKARRTVGQFKDGVRMTHRSVRPTPPPPATPATGVQHLWSSKSNGKTKNALKRFHSCSPNLTSRKEGGLNNNSKKEQTKPLVGMEINHHDNALVNNSGNSKPNEIAHDHKNDIADVTRPPFDPSIETKILKEA